MAEQTQSIGPQAARWAQSIVQQRGVHGIRVVMGLVNLTQHHPIHAIERACEVAQSHSAHRLRDLRNLLKRSTLPGMQQEFDFVAEHPLIRSLADYGQLVHAAFEQAPSL